MTAKEKALELVNTFSLPFILTHNESKIFASKAVDEIINNVRTDYHDHQWYRQVKQEIEKL